MTHRAFALAALLAVTAACEHTPSGGIENGGDVGPSGPSLPRRLTFYDGDDLTPSVFGSTIVYSRQSPSSEPSDYDPDGWGREACLAFVGVEGGTIERELCPDRLLPRADTIVDTWYEPAVSPDGSRLAFLWKRGPRVGALGFNDAYLTVTPADRPTAAPVARVIVDYLEPGAAARRANVPTRVTWPDDAHVRFLATEELVIKIKNYGPERYTDTLQYPLALMELDVTAGTTRVLPGGDSVVAYANAPDGAVWVAYAWDSTAVQRLDQTTGARTLIGRFDSPVRDLAAVGGTIVALTADGYRVAMMDPGSGLVETLVDFFSTPPFKDYGPARRVVPAGGRRYVLQVDRVPFPLGAAPDLWLLELR